MLVFAFLQCQWRNAFQSVWFKHNSSLLIVIMWWFVSSKPRLVQKRRCMLGSVPMLIDTKQTAPGVFDALVAGTNVADRCACIGCVAAAILDLYDVCHNRNDTKMVSVWPTRFGFTGTLRRRQQVEG